MTNRIKELEQKINQARKEYYNGQSSISDQIFDAWIEELSQLDPKNFAVVGIGSEPVSNWEKYTHVFPMGSLNKCQTADEFQKWAETYNKDEKFFVTLKLDGLSVSLIYENGILVKAATRGSGVIGELITANVVKMMGVPLRLSKKINITVRGEILLSKENHKKYFSEYSNARNAASGISRRYDGKGSDKLSVLAYQIYSDDISFNTQNDVFQYLINLGFNVPSFFIVNDVRQILILKESYQQDLRNKYDFDLDGLVIHNNNIVKQLTFGSVNNRPKASIAYKFDNLFLETTIAEIHCQVGNSGRITPVAIFNPKIHLMGADIERASLHNFSNIAALGIDVGCKVLVCRSNDVIPYVAEVTQTTNTIFNIPATCPACNTKVQENGEYAQCPNFNCVAQVGGRIKNWIKELNLLEWGDALIQRLLDSGKVISVVDLYKLTVKDLASLDRMGDKSSQKCYDILHANKELSLETFLGALSIPLIGTNTIKLITEAGYDSLEKIQSMNSEDLEKIHGLGPAKATSFLQGLATYNKLIKELLQNGITIKPKIVGKFNNISFCFTGTMENKRAILEKMVTDNGGILKNSVSKDLSYLVINDLNSASSKAVAAKKLNIKLISEEHFLKLSSTN